MNWLKRSFSISCFVIALMTTGISNAKAETLQVVFTSSLWGSGIGGVSGLALWALQDEDKEDKIFSKYIIKGMAFGVFVGMAVGIYDAQSGGDVFMSKQQPKGLLHLDVDASILAVRPAQLIPNPQLDWQGKPAWNLNVFTASF